MPKHALANDHPLVKAAQVLFFLNTATWLVIGVTTLVRMMNNSDQKIIAGIIAVLMFGNAAAMLLSGVLLSKDIRWWYYFAVVTICFVTDAMMRSSSLF